MARKRNAPQRNLGPVEDRPSCDIANATYADLTSTSCDTDDDRCALTSSLTQHEGALHNASTWAESAMSSCIGRIMGSIEILFAIQRDIFKCIMLYTCWTQYAGVRQGSVAYRLGSYRFTWKSFGVLCISVSEIQLCFTGIRMIRIMNTVCRNDLSESIFQHLRYVSLWADTGSLPGLQ